MKTRFLFGVMSLLMVSPLIGVSVAHGANKAPDSCSNIGTEQQRNLANGWQEIAYDTDGWGGHVLYLDGSAIPGEQLIKMSEGQRVTLAYRWVDEYDGYVEFTQFRENVAACIEQHGLPGSSGTYSSEDTACASDMTALTEIASLAGVAEADRGVLFGCRLDRRGRWILPTGPDDPRLAERPILDSTEVAKVQQLHLALLDQLGEFEGQLNSVANPFVSPNQWTGDSLLDMLYAQYYDPAKHAGSGHTKVDAYLSSFVWDAYWGRFVPYLQSPQHLELNRYVQWWLGRRQSVVNQVITGSELNPLSKQALATQLLRIPWTWELQNDLDLTEYLNWAISAGFVP